MQQQPWPAPDRSHWGAVFVTPKYQASSTIYVISQKDSDINMSDLQIGTALTDDYIQVFHMWEVQEKVISNLTCPIPTASWIRCSL